MLKVKNLTHLSKKKMKKGGNFDHGCKMMMPTLKKSQNIKFEGIIS